MIIGIFGCGYVGITTGVCLTEIGHKVICYDIDNNKIRMLQQGIVSIYEKNLSSMALNALSKQMLYFTSDYKCMIKESEVIFITVGTPCMSIR